MSEDKAVLIKTAYSYYQKGDWDKAIEEYHKLADLDAKDLNVHNMLADIYAKKGDVSEALQQYDLVAQGFDQKNLVDKVLQVYKRMLKLTPNDPDLLAAVKNLMDKYMSRATQAEEKEPEKAAEIYRSILKAEPTRIDANFQYSKLLMKSGKKFEAIEGLMALTASLDPETQTGKLVEILKLVADLDPMNIDAREKLVELLEKGKMIDAAVKSLQDLIEIFISRNDFGKAEEAAKKAIQLGDQNTYYHLGVVYFNQQKYDESRAAFEKFLQQQGAHVGALKYLALVFLRLNRNQDAVQVYLKILGVYYNENLLDEAREVRQTILELDPENSDVKKYSLDKDLPAPIPQQPDAAVLEAARQEEELQIRNTISQAEGFSEKGLYEQAIDVYLDMLKKWPQLSDIRVRLQQVYALMARAMEPPEKRLSPDEIKSELEKELREQIRHELEEQAKQAKEVQNEMERKREMDQMKMKQELETKILEQVQRSQEEDLRQRLNKEFEEKQRLLDLDRERLEKEKAQSYERLKSELEETKSSLEKKIREEIEIEIQEKNRISAELEKEKLRNAHREEIENEIQEKKKISEALEKEKSRNAQMKELLNQEEEQRKQYDLRKKEQEEDRARINQEILQGMERLRLEKERETKSSGTPLITLAPGMENNHEPTKTGKSSQESLEDPFIRQTLADIYAKQGLFVEALKIYEKILLDEPDNQDVKEKLRNILRMKGI